MNAKQLPRELYLFFGSKEVAEKIYKMIHGEQVKNTKELATLNRSRCVREKKTYKMQACREESPRSLVGLRIMQRPSLTTTMRVAAAVELEQRRRLREEEDEEERRMGRTGRVPIYKGRCEQAGAKIKETQ